jgi:hypothetical protein
MIEVESNAEVGVGCSPGKASEMIWAAAARRRTRGSR